MPPKDFAGLIGKLIEPIRAVLPLIASLALLAFVWGLVKFIARAGGDEKAITEGKKLMIWGLVALFIMISVWGILRLFYSELGFSRAFGLPLLP